MGVASPVTGGLRVDRVDLSIGELARLSGVPVKTIRYYSDIGLLPADGRTSGGYPPYGRGAPRPPGVLPTPPRPGARPGAHPRGPDPPSRFSAGGGGPARPPGNPDPTPRL